MGVIYFLIFAILIAIPITAFIEWKKEKARKREESLLDIEYYTNKIDIENMSDEEYKAEILKQAKNININIIELQGQLNRQKKMLEEIQNNVGCITTVLLLPIAIGIVTFIISAAAGYNILQNLFQ